MDFSALAELAHFASAADNPSPVKAEIPSAVADSDNKASEPYDNHSDEEAEDDDDARLPPRKPFTRTMQKQEKEAPQKWVQCARCNKWRRVPFTLKDEDTPDDWECANNEWDKAHASCMIPQALSDEEIDEILAHQAELEVQAELLPLLYPPPEERLADDEGDDDEMGEQGYDDMDAGSDGEDSILGSRRGSRGKQGALMRSGSQKKGRSGSGGGRTTKGPATGARGYAADPSMDLAALNRARANRGRGGGKRGNGMEIIDYTNGAGSSFGALPAGSRDSKAARQGLYTARPGLTNRPSGGQKPLQPPMLGGRKGSGNKGVGGLPVGKGLAAAQGLPASAVARGRGRIGRGLSEAAEALLGMGGEKVEDDPMDDEELEEGVETSPTAMQHGSSHTLGPGKVVWAKVEGHDWWPARVVRRRAVPREVGAPPGGPLEVQAFIPVVFFTAKGIPGEVSEATDTVEGALAACTRALNLAAVGEGEGEEAEYAWLQPESLKPFSAGTSSSNPDGFVSSDPNLQSCIAAANRALKAAATRRRQAREEGSPADNASDVGANDDSSSISDSDGGWGVPAAPDSGRSRAGRGRGARGRRGGRGRGAKKVGRGSRRGGRNVLANDDDACSNSEGETPTAAGLDANDGAQHAAGVPKILVDSIWGWRWPAGADDAAARGDSSRPGSARASGRPSRAPRSPFQMDDAAEPGAGRGGRVKQEQADDDDEDGIPQDEADAVAALLAAASGEAGDDGTGLPRASGEREYLVKWVGRSHMHNEWVQEALLARIAKRKLVNFQRRHVAAEQAPCVLMEEAWRLPERFVARRPNPVSPGWQVLVKWTGLPYDCASWEAEGEGLMVQPNHGRLHRDLWARQHAALERAQPSAVAAAAAVRRGTAGVLGPLDKKPDFVLGSPLYPHQLQAVNWMRSMWAQGKHSLLADEMGLGKTASVITFIQCLRREMRCCQPILFVVPLSSLAFWEGEWAFWAGPDADIISWAGSAATRATLVEHELWLSPTSLDSRACLRSREHMSGKVVKADVVLASHEALAGDSAALRTVNWECIVLDQRDRLRSSLSKAAAALHDVPARHRLLLSHSHPCQNSFQGMLQELGFLMSEIQDVGDLPGDSPEDLDEPEQVALIMSLLEPLLLRRLRSEVQGPIKLPDAPTVEVSLPVELSREQQDCYRTVLARFYEVLADPRPPRHAGHRAAQMRTACSELRKACNHPHLLPDFEPSEPGGSAEEESQALVQASGKMMVLHALIPKLKAAGRRILLLSQMSKMLDMLEEHFGPVLGPGAVERIDITTPSAQRHSIIQRFNEPDSPCCLFLLATRACGLGTNLPGIDTVIIHDSDWNQLGDLQALRRARCLGKPEPAAAAAADTPAAESATRPPAESAATYSQQPVVLRLFVRNSAEERALQLTDRRDGFEAAFKPAIGSRASASSTRLLDDILRFGSQAIFAQVPALPNQAAPDAAAAEAAPELRAAQPAAYTDAVLDLLVSRTAPGSLVSQRQEAAGEQQQGAAVPSFSLGPGLEGLMVKEWGTDLQDPAAPSDDMGEHGEEPEEDAGNEEEEAATPRTADRDMHHADSSARSAAFWEGLLQPVWRRMKLEEEETLAQAAAAGTRAGSHGPTAEAAADGPADSAFADAGKEVSPVISEDEQEADEMEVDAPSAPAREPATAGLRERSSHTLEAAEENNGGPKGGRANAKGGVRGVGRGRGGGSRGRGTRRKKADLSETDDERAADRNDEGHAPKRRRRGADAVKAEPQAADVELLQEEFARHDAILRAISEPGTLESAVAKAAFDRINMFVDDLQLSAPVAEIAHQTAQVLMFMRPEADPPAAFQEYALLAIVAAAAHVGGAFPGDKQRGLPMLAARYHHSPDQLEQVFNYIMQTLTKYRQLHLKGSVLLRGSTSPQEAGPPSHAASPFAGHDGMERSPVSPALRGTRDANSAAVAAAAAAAAAQHGGINTADPQAALLGQTASDVAARLGISAGSGAPGTADIFAQKLAHILAADFTGIAMQTPLDLREFPLPTLPADIERTNPSLAAEFEQVTKNLRTLTSQIALLDRIHSIKVKHIQEEYQKYMEQVRGRAQSAIDQANQLFQGRRSDYAAHVDALVHFMQSRFLSLQQQAPPTGHPSAAAAAPVDQAHAEQPSAAALQQQAAAAAPASASQPQPQANANANTNAARQSQSPPLSSDPPEHERQQHRREAVLQAKGEQLHGHTGADGLREKALQNGGAAGSMPVGGAGETITLAPQRQPTSLTVTVTGSGGQKGPQQPGSPHFTQYRPSAEQLDTFKRFMEKHNDTAAEPSSSRTTAQLLPPKLHKSHGSLQHGTGNAHKALGNLNRRSPALAPKPPLPPPHTTVPVPINTSAKERSQAGGGNTIRSSTTAVNMPKGVPAADSPSSPAAFSQGLLHGALAMGALIPNNVAASASGSQLGYAAPGSYLYPAVQHLASQQALFSTRGGGNWQLPVRLSDDQVQKLAAQQQQQHGIMRQQQTQAQTASSAPATNQDAVQQAWLYGGNRFAEASGSPRDAAAAAAGANLLQAATSAAAVSHAQGLPASMSVGPTIQSGVPGSSATAHRNSHPALPQALAAMAAGAGLKQHPGEELDPLSSAMQLAQLEHAAARQRSPGKHSASEASHRRDDASAKELLRAVTEEAGLQQPRSAGVSRSRSPSPMLRRAEQHKQQQQSAAARDSSLASGRPIMTTPAASPARRLVISQSDLGPRSSVGFKPVRSSDPGVSTGPHDDSAMQPPPPPRVVPTSEERQAASAAEPSHVGSVPEAQREVGQKQQRDADKDSSMVAHSDVAGSKRMRTAQRSPERQHPQAATTQLGAQPVDRPSGEVPSSHQRASSPQGSPHRNMLWHAQQQQQQQHNDRAFASNAHAAMSASDLLSHAMGFHSHADRDSQQWGAAEMSSAGMTDIASHQQQSHQQQHNSMSAHRRPGGLASAPHKLREQAGLQRTREETQ